MEFSSNNGIIVKTVLFHILLNVVLQTMYTIKVMKTNMNLFFLLIFVWEIQNN